MCKILIVLGILIVTTTTDLFSQSELHLMPYPSDVKEGNGRFDLKKDFTVSVENGSPRLFRGSTRFLRRLDGRTGLFFQQDQISGSDYSDTASLLIKISHPKFIRPYDGTFV
jgi:hexosaminidase